MDPRRQLVFCISRTCHTLKPEELLTRIVVAKDDALGK